MSQLYDQKIYSEQITDEQYKSSIRDLQTYLQSLTGKSFDLKPKETLVQEGIYILLYKEGILKSDLGKKLTDGTIEDFVIAGDQNRLLLVATHPLGLCRAIYTYLDQLGVRWYFPGDEWTIVPGLSDITINKQEFYTPSFSIRNFFGTGGIVPVVALDSTKMLQQKWDDWKRRNRMGGAYTLAGHYGEAFNLKYKTELTAHPEYLALVNGKRTPWNPSAKWCVSNKAFRDLFIQDRIQALQEALKRNSYKNQRITLSVEPADGSGDCECAFCKRMGSVSDRYFFLANEVAKAVAAISPSALVNLYAYNTHAAPPSFKLEPNVLVQIIPYAFQDVGTPEEMIAGWQKKCSRLFIYDYYGLPDWHFDTPLTGRWSTDSLMAKLKEWQKQQIEGFLLESSYSIGCTGLGLYLMSRQGWNRQEDTNTDKERLYNSLFGTAASYVRGYYEKIDHGFRGAVDLPYLMDRIAKAESVAKDPAIRQRLVSLEAYLHYLILYYRWQSADADTKANLWNNFMRYTWQVYPRAVVHSTRIAQLLYRQLPDKSLADTWSLNNRGNDLGHTTFLMDADVQRLFADDRKSYPLLPGFSYSSTEGGVTYTIRTDTPSGTTNPKGVMLLEFPETLIRAGQDGYFHFMLKTNETSAKNLKQTVLVNCFDTAGDKSIYTRKIDIDTTWRKIDIKLPAGKTYMLSVKNTNWIKLYVPDNQWAGFKTLPVYSILGRLWFYVPLGVSDIYYSNLNATEQPVFRDVSGQLIKPEPVNDLRQFRIATGASAGAWWSVEENQYKKLEFYNYPDLFFMHPNFTANAK